MSEEHPAHTMDEVQHEAESHDDWFRHAPGEEHQAAHGDFNPYVVMAFLGVTMMVVLVVAVLVIPWFGRLVQGQRIAVREQSNLVVQEYKDKSTLWTQHLTDEPTWVNESENVVRVPIDLAMDQVVARYGIGGN